MTQQGEHTWDMVIDYKRCPKCGYINENRDEFQYRMGSWVKDITCGRCGNAFTVKDERKATFGPLIGRPQPPEITWM
jgi:ssDNA-binding Zn-finger/Zn-ribbon topoisomerase 1